MDHQKPFYEILYQNGDLNQTNKTISNGLCTIVYFNVILKDNIQMITSRGSL